MEISAQNETNNNNNSAAANKFSSLSSEEDGYLLGTPPTMSLDSDIQPCAIDIITENSQPSSLSNISENNNSEVKSVSSSAASDYKCITTESHSMEKQNMDTNLQKDILNVDSSTDDQMSSGTFSHDEISPRYADLPATLNLDKRRTQSSVDPPRRDSDVLRDVGRKSSVQERSMSLETRSVSITSDTSEQEIPPTTPRSDPTVSPGSDQAQTQFEYEDTGAGDDLVEKSCTDIMTQSIYIGSEDPDNSEVSSESHLSTITTQQTVSSSETDSKVTTLVTEESTSVFESVIKMSENVTENILEETKTITKSTKLAVEESVIVQAEVSDEREEEAAEEVSGVTDQKKQSITVVSTESSVMVTKTDTRTYSDVLKSDSKQTVTTSTSSEQQSSLGKDAASEVLKSETVLQLVGSSSSSDEGKTKKLSYSEVVKADSKDKSDKDDPTADWGKPLGLPSPVMPSSPHGPLYHCGEDVDDIIAEWGEPLGLPSPIRPSTPAKQQRKTNDEPSVDTNKVTLTRLLHSPLMKLLLLLEE